MDSKSPDFDTAEPREVSPVVETKGGDEKGATFSKENDLEHGIKYEAEEEGSSAVVETATDLVTKVIHVEDDPNMTVVTFRVVFLGSFLLKVEYTRPKRLLTPTKVSGFPSSALSSRKSFTSSRRLFSSPWSS